MNVHRISGQRAFTSGDRNGSEDGIHVVSFHSQHPYHRVIYDQLKGRIVERARIPSGQKGGPPFQPWDVFHLHWPEWPVEALGPDAKVHREFIELLVDSSSRILWTQHNLTPHSKDSRYEAIYDLWAAAANGVIHHSAWGMKQTMERRRFRNDAVHRVIPHPHFGPASTRGIQRSRSRSSSRKGPIRIGIIGAPRQERNVALAIEAFLASNRQDLRLVIFSCDSSQLVPADKRIEAHPAGWIPRPDYEKQLARMDVLLMPFAKEGMLGTGTVADAIGFGIPAIISDWPYLTEIFGDSAIHYGSSARDLTDVLTRLDRAAIDEAAMAIRDIRPAYEPARVAALTMDLLETITSTEGQRA